VCGLDTSNWYDENREWAMHENGRMAERNYGKSNLVSFYISQKILSYAYLLLGYFGDFKSLYIKIIF